MPIDPRRIAADIEKIASFNETDPAVGYSRPTFSWAWGDARDYVIDQAESAGCAVHIDAAGNVFCRPKNLTGPAWLAGSHLDSVPTGGKFDGVVGVVVPLELIRAGVPLELVLFAEEEGTTFGVGMIGSRLWAGDLTADTLASFKNKSGQTYAAAGEPFGVDPSRWPLEKPAGYRGFIEVHIEQGPSLWTANQPLAVVDPIAGRRQYKVRFEGVPNHAGSTGMNHRHDALAAAADVILHVEAVARHLSPTTVATVGRIEVEPNAVNVIPGRATFTIDLRSPIEELLIKGDKEIRRFVDRTTRARGVTATLVQTEQQPVVAMDAELVGRLKQLVPVTMPSGALHDAAVMAPHIPTAMLFVASKDGVSHNPAEFSRIEDIAAAAEALREIVEEN